MPSSADLLKDIPFLIVIIPKRYKKDIMTLLQNASDIKATVTVPLQKRNERKLPFSCVCLWMMFLNGCL